MAGNVRQNSDKKFGAKKKRPEGRFLHRISKDLISQAKTVLSETRR